MSCCPWRCRFCLRAQWCYGHQLADMNEGTERFHRRTFVDNSLHKPLSQDLLQWELFVSETPNHGLFSELYPAFFRICIHLLHCPIYNFCNINYWLLNICFVPGIVLSVLCLLKIISDIYCGLFYVILTASPWSRSYYHFQITDEETEA